MRRAWQRTVIALSFGALSALAGCLDVTEEIRVNGDGSGRLHVDLAVSDKVTALAALAGDKSPLPFNEADLRTALSSSDNIESFTVTTKQGDAMTHTVVEAVVKDFTRPLPRLQTSPTDGSATTEALVPFTIRRLENKNLHFRHELSGVGNGKAKNQAAGLVAGLALADRNLTVRLYGNIVSANGNVAEDKRSVEWRIPLAQILAGTAVLRELEAEIAPPAFSGLTTVFIVTLGVAGLAIFGIVHFRRKFL